MLPHPWRTVGPLVPRRDEVSSTMLPAVKEQCPRGEWSSAGDELAAVCKASVSGRLNVRNRLTSATYDPRILA